VLDKKLQFIYVRFEVLYKEVPCTLSLPFFRKDGDSVLHQNIDLVPPGYTASSQSIILSNKIFFTFSIFFYC
jgi:hypothetical protein